MKSTNTKCLYWEIKNKFDDIRPVLYSLEGEKPTYVSDSLMDNYAIDETDDTKTIFEAAVIDFNMSDKDKPYLWKLLTDFSIEKFLNYKQDNEFLNFLWNYNFSISVCPEIFMK